MILRLRNPSQRVVMGFGMLWWHAPAIRWNRKPRSRAETSKMPPIQALQNSKPQDKQAVKVTNLNSPHPRHEAAVRVQRCPPSVRQNSQLVLRNYSRIPFLGSKANQIPVRTSEIQPPRRYLNHNDVVIPAPSKTDMTLTVGKRLLFFAFAAATRMLTRNARPQVLRMEDYSPPSQAVLLGCADGQTHRAFGLAASLCMVFEIYGRCKCIF
jgi:hypothetical protein